MRTGGGLLVVEGKDHNITADCVGLADGLQMMHAGSQFPGNPHSLTGLGLLPAAVIKPIAHRGGNGLALQVTVAEGDGL